MCVCVWVYIYIYIYIYMIGLLNMTFCIALLKLSVWQALCNILAFPLQYHLERLTVKTRTVLEYQTDLHVLYVDVELRL
jgi:hypothetical protein